MEEQQKQKKSDPRQLPGNMLDSLDLLASGMCIFEVLFTSGCDYGNNLKKMRGVLVKKKIDRGDFPSSTWKIMVYLIIEDSRRFFSFEVPYDVLLEGSNPYSVDQPESELGEKKGN